MKEGISIATFVLAFLPSLTFGFNITGKIRNAGNDKYRVSIFHLRNINEFFILTGYNLVEYDITDSAGHFLLHSDLAPDEETIYRIHIKKIEHQRDTIGDLMDSEMSVENMATANYLYISLKNTSDVFIDIENKENYIFNHKLSATGSAFPELYGLLRKYDNGIIELKKTATHKQGFKPGSETESLLKQKIYQLKNALYQDLSNFIKNTHDMNAAALAYGFIERSFKPTLEQKELLFEKIEDKGSKSKYLLSIKTQLENENKTMTFVFLKKYAIAISVLSVLLLILSIVLFIKLRASLTKLKATYTEPKDVYALLSRKELEIFEMLGSGLSNKEIAAAQYLELSTVKRHITNIYAKTGLKSRNEAMHILKENKNRLIKG
jgi:DNA-binding CsgD family transcriptional regulator